VRRGRIPAERLRKIEQGSGPMDIAEDGAAIVEALTPHIDASDVRSLLSPGDLARMRELSDELLDLLVPSGARKSAPAGTSPEARDRDALAALLRSRYQVFRAVAYERYGDGFDAYVPPLLSAQYAVATEDDEGGGGEGGAKGQPA
jgi:hypothetical protein